MTCTGWRVSRFRLFAFFSRRLPVPGERLPRARGERVRTLRSQSFLPPTPLPGCHALTARGETRAARRPACLPLSPLPGYHALTTLCGPACHCCHLPLDFPPDSLESGRRKLECLLVSRCAMVHTRSHAYRQVFFFFFPSTFSKFCIYVNLLMPSRRTRPTRAPTRV